MSGKSQAIHRSVAQNRQPIGKIQDMNVFNSLDIRTAYLIAGLASLLSASAMFVLRSLHKPSQTAAVVMASALACGGTSLVMAADRGLNSSAFVLWLSLLLSGACFAMMLESVRQLYGHRPGYGFCAVIIALFGVGLAFSTNSRTILLWHFGYQSLCSLAIMTLVMRSQDEQAPTQRFGMLALFIGLSLTTSMRWFDSLYAGDIVLLSPSLKYGAAQGPAVALYTLSPVIMMILVLAILNARQVAELTVAASTDDLTGLASRRFLLRSAAQWRQTVQEQNNSCALLMIDVDQFKSINDRFGHETGDLVLCHIARTLNANLRGDAILARYGGEEFCALVPIERPAEAEAAAERLRKAMEITPFRDGLTQINITISVGVAMHGAQQTLQEVLRIADRRVYRAKDLGRNRVVDEDFATEPVESSESVEPA
jgi:diguanylate cyclase (GGDEF)-like protein